MSERAQITVSSGPDRGKVFTLNDELVNIGSSEENQVVLSDPSLAGYQASITRKGERYAIWTPLDRIIEVDGNAIPAEHWVWLPTSARIRISDRTAFQFSCRVDAAAGDTLDESLGTEHLPIAATPNGRSARAATGKRRPEKTKRQVARFITDQPGDPLVKLGEDGHLPELTLTEGDDPRPHEKLSKDSNRAVLYAVLALSIACSLALLFLDIGPAGSSATDKARARAAIKRFYGSSDEEPKLYQRYLRDARLAHSRNNRIAERHAYRRVLELLTSEDFDRSYTGVTGDKGDLLELPRSNRQLLERLERQGKNHQPNDQVLARLIAILLSD